MDSSSQSNLVTETAPSTSDAGGVAARHGFRYQDHVAAKYFIGMLASSQCDRIECETADDILIVWNSGGEIIHEYIQVKTTDGDSKWAMKELMGRSNPKTPSSIPEASLNCDKYEARPKFKLVTRRDVNKLLGPLKIPFSQRSSESGVKELAAKIFNKRKTAKSPRGHDLNFWAQNVHWEVFGDKQSLEAINLNQLNEVCSQFGAIPDHSQLKELYNKILKWVDDAAEASRKTAPTEKAILKHVAKDWFNTQVKEILSSRSSTQKPYRAPTPKFFSKLTVLSEDEIRRAMTSYDVEFQFKKWRSLPLAEHLVSWLPEVCLKASEIVNVDQFSLDQKFQSAIKKIGNDTSLNVETILSETLLHALIRHFFDSEPIACKIFSGSSEGIRHFGNAHVVKSERGDELWLGRSVVVAADSMDEISERVGRDLKELLVPELLLKEKEILIALREPQHLLPTDLEEPLDQGVSFDRLLKRICVPVLVGYDSSVIAEGFAEDYREKLEQEVQSAYTEVKQKLPDELDQLEIRVHVMVLPLECAMTLLQQFENILKKHEH